MIAEERPNYYSILPATVRYDKELKPNEKLLYSEITALTNKHGECWATNRYFANLFQVSVWSVSNWIKHLGNLGYIDVQIVYKTDSREISKRVIKINEISSRKTLKVFTTNDEEN